MKISIIIPVFNESNNIASLLEHLVELISSRTEIIIVDGGSTDNTKSLLESNAMNVVSSAKGRARQMNIGAKIATGDVFLFLHADTRLPELFHSAIENAMVNNTSIWGRFDVKIEGSSFMFAMISFAMNHRSRLFSIATGDQAIFVKRVVFESMGGFPEQPLMEDIEICKRLKKISTPICLHDKVITSGRRWEQKGIFRTIFLMWRLRWRYWRGADVNEIAKLYQ